jgi:hypothetical protein
LSTTVDFATVTHAIGALSISGVTVLDTHNITDSIGLGTAILAPMPVEFVSNIELSRDELSGQLLTLRYTLTYRYYHCAIAGGLGGIFGPYSAMITNAAAILKAFASDATLAGAVDNDLPTISNIGPVNDPAGNGFHGFDITIRIMQFLEV